MPHPTIPVSEDAIRRLLQDHVATLYGVHPGAVTLHCLHRRGEDAGVDYSAEVEILPIDAS